MECGCTSLLLCTRANPIRHGREGARASGRLETRVHPCTDRPWLVIDLMCVIRDHGDTWRRQG